jgi:tetratricopeptide (TPR) repeat protein
MTPDTVTPPQRVARFASLVRENRGNFFEWLGLTPAATMKEIDAAYHALHEEITAMADADGAAGDTSHPTFALAAALARAYETLSDYNKRSAYEKRGFRPEGSEPARDDPDEQARTLLRKAQALYSRKQYRLGARVADEAIRLVPDRAEFHLLRGLCLTEFPEEKRQAEASLLKAAELEPWNAEHLVALGLLFHSVRLTRRAEAYYRQALALESGHAVARRKLAEIAGPDRTPMEQLKEKVQNQLKKGLPVLKKCLPSLFRNSGRRG